MSGSRFGGFFSIARKVKLWESPGKAGGLPWINYNDPVGERRNSYLRDLIDRVDKLAVVDPAHAFIQYVLFLDERNQIRMRPFGATGLTALASTPLTEEGQRYVYRGGILQRSESLIPGLSNDVLARFEDLMNSSRAKERDFQLLFTEYPFLLTGLDFRRAHPQPILHMDEGGTLIPDFFLEKLAGGWDAILDLKKPYDEMIVRRQNRVYFTQHVQNAVAQLRFYREWFDNKRNRDSFADRYGVQVFRPRMVIVVGRIHHFRDDIERIRLLDGLPQQLEIWTYDALYRKAREYLRFLNGQ